MLTQILKVGKQSEPTIPHGSALKGIYMVLESKTFFVSLEKQCEAGGEAGSLPSDIDSRFASSVTLPSARALPQHPGVCWHLPWEADHLGAQKVL